MNGIARLRQLVSPLGGLVGRLDRASNHPGEPAFPVVCAQLGNVNRILWNARLSTGERLMMGEMDGAGSALDADTAALRAIAEAIERYSSCVFSEEQFIWATASELGSEALDLDLVPRCSDRELSHPACPLRAPDKTAPIRWVRGISLSTCEPVWIPAIMVYLYMPYASIGERFWLPISTGCAAHFSLEQALVSAICEVVERDAISLVWLQQLAIPRLEIDVERDELAPLLSRLERSHVRTYLFDATTDIGIPTVYSLDVASHNRRLATLVMCATDLDPVRAIAKVLRESASSRIAMQAAHTIPDSVDQFASVFHGAVYMATPDKQDAFRFLLDSPGRKKLSELLSLDTGDARQNLMVLLRHLQKRGMEAFAVDLTTDEALRVGMRVVRVLIPALQPLSFAFRARYLGHPRLYSAPSSMGYPVRTEDQVNFYPQPFA